MRRKGWAANIATLPELLQKPAYPTHFGFSLLRGRPIFCVMPHYAGHLSAPRMIAALAGLVHGGQSAADSEYNHDKDNQYGGLHCDLRILRANRFLYKTRGIAVGSL